MFKHSLIWIVGVIAALLLTPMLMGSAAYKSAVNWEKGQALQWYGEENLDEIVSQTEVAYSLLMVDTGIDPGLRSLYKTQEDQSSNLGTGKASKALKWFGTRLFDVLSALLYSCYLFCYRLAHLKFWAFYTQPFLWAVLLDGVMDRKARRESFEYSSPSAYNISWHVIIATVSMTIVLSALPLKLPSVFFPVILCLVGYMARNVLANIQPSA